MSSPRFRRTRIVCVSDTHNTTLSLPAGDILIHAGDLTNQGSHSELKRTLEWLKKADFKIKLIVAGNHDVSLDKSFYTEYGSYFHNQSPQDPDECRRLFEMFHIHYLQHETATITLSFSDGEKVKFRVFGSPYSPSRGLWAFGYSPEDAEGLWERIPLDADIVITHTPPKYHCDEHSERGPAGCEALRRALWRVRPKLHVCGHVHEGRGAETIHWDLESPNVKFKEKTTSYWHDTTSGTKKQFKIDITKPELGDLNQSKGATTLPLEESLKNVVLDKSVSSLPFPDHNKAVRPIPPEVQSANVHTPAAYGLGGVEGSNRVDKDAIDGRIEKTHTLVVNAAITGSNFPHKTGKKINKPIVVDLLLPIVEDD